MTEFIEMLLGIASAAICSPLPETTRSPLPGSGLGQELEAMLQLRNGFYAFESALHVFPFEDCGPETGLRRWNSAELWRYEYKALLEGHFFFAEDVFGGQFSIRDDHIWMVDPETGDASAIADSLEGWAQKLVEDGRVLTGWPLGHEWQMKHGPIPIGRRLMPGRLFVLGGEFEVDNLAAVEAIQAMQLRGSIAVQLHEVPDKTQVRLTFE